MKRLIVCLFAVIFIVGCGTAYTTQNTNQSSNTAGSRKNTDDKQKALMDRIEKISIGEPRNAILKEWGKPAESKVDKTINSQVITTDYYRFDDEKMVWSFVYSNGVLDGKYLVQDAK